MIRSMTGFASLREDTQWGQLVFEMRSLNHRYQELVLRLPDEFRVLEPELRELLGDTLRRGKVEVYVRFKADPAHATTLVLNDGLVAQLQALRAQLHEAMPGLTEPTATEVLGWPGLVTEAGMDLAPLHQELLQLAGRALEKMVAFREREGTKISQMVGDRLDQVEALVQEARSLMPTIAAQQKARLVERVEQLQMQPVDEGRLEQEVALLLQRLDVAEELDRLGAHLTEVRRTLARTEPVGRRLDFLMQELHREANTLGSKSVDARSSQISVDLKVLIEQMREQVQNIE